MAKVASASQEKLDPWKTMGLGLHCHELPQPPKHRSTNQIACSTRVHRPTQPITIFINAHICMFTVQLAEKTSDNHGCTEQEARAQWEAFVSAKPTSQLGEVSWHQLASKNWRHSQEAPRSHGTNDHQTTSHLLLLGQGCDRLCIWVISIPGAFLPPRYSSQLSSPQWRATFWCLKQVLKQQVVSKTLHWSWN